MSGLSASGLKTQIRSYTEVDDTVLTDAVLENIILNAQQRIMMDVPIDADRFVQEGTLVADDNTINAPAGCLFVNYLVLNNVRVCLFMKMKKLQNRKKYVQNIKMITI